MRRLCEKRRIRVKPNADRSSRVQGNSPGLVADNPVLRDATPGLKRHNGGFRMRPEIAVDPLRRCVPPRD
jgi:hypothetical protein